MGETLVEVKPQKKSGCGAFQIGFLVFIVVALAIGLAVGFTLKPSSDSNTANVQSSTSNKTAPAAAGSNPNKPSRPAMYEKLVPPEGQIYTGFHLDWSSEKPTTIVSFLNGRKPAIFNAFVTLNAGSPAFDRDMIIWHASEIRAVQAMMQLTVLPMGIETMSQAVIDEFATFLAEINVRFDVPILLRYGHEMNGPWAEFGMKPTAYVQNFRLMADAVHERTKMTMMMWAPNTGDGYPYGSYTRAAFTNSLDFDLLDTNGNGQIDAIGDDPFLPYWPGPQYVDWVGLSTYWYGVGNGIPVGGYFSQSLVGNGDVLNQVNPINPLRNFYARFAEAFRKPMAIPETGAPTCSNAVQVPPTVLTEVGIRRNWWNQLWAPEIAQNYPYLKAITFFEEAKPEGGYWKDWRIVHNATVRQAYVDDLPSFASRMHWASDIPYFAANMTQ